MIVQIVQDEFCASGFSEKTESLHGRLSSQGRIGICTVFSSVITGQCCKSLWRDGYVIGADISFSLSSLQAFIL